MTWRKKLSVLACRIMGGHCWRFHVDARPHEDGKRHWYGLYRYCVGCGKSEQIPFTIQKTYSPDQELALAS